MSPGFCHFGNCAANAPKDHRQLCAPSMLDMATARNNRMKMPPPISKISMDNPQSPANSLPRVKPGRRVSFPASGHDLTRKSPHKGQMRQSGGI
jgi:hypothetical protein